ncbi:sensory histidine kinase DcuS [compost metagenome]
MTFGKLTISGIREHQRILLIVSDDGAGIEEDRLQAIKLSMSDSQHQVGYGLSSVNERAKLYFGLLYGIDIKSEVGIGTVVTVVLPYQGE